MHLWGLVDLEQEHKALLALAERRARRGERPRRVGSRLLSALRAACRLRRIGQQNALDRRPCPILQIDQRRIGDDGRGRSALPAALHQDGNFDLAVGVIEIAAAVAAVEGRSNSRDLVNADDDLRGRVMRPSS